MKTGKTHPNKWKVPEKNQLRLKLSENGSFSSQNDICSMSLGIGFPVHRYTASSVICWEAICVDYIKKENVKNIIRITKSQLNNMHVSSAHLCASYKIMLTHARVHVELRLHHDPNFKICRLVCKRFKTALGMVFLIHT